MLQQHRLLGVLLVLLTGFLQAANPNQTRRQNWEENARKDIATFFETTLDTRGELRKRADYSAAQKLLQKYEQQAPVLEPNGQVVVKEPLKEFLSAPYGNYPGGKSNERPIQGVFYERARQKDDGERQDNLDKIAILFIDKSDPNFFTAPLTSMLNEKITGSDLQLISYLLFALKYGMVKVSKKLLEKNPFLAQGKASGRSVYSYAFEGGINDRELIEKLGKAGAIIQEADFDYLKDQNQKAGFLNWLIEHDISLKNVAVTKIEGLKKGVDKLIAERTLGRFAQSLYQLAHG